MITTTICAAAPKAYDVKNFDVAGVKLGMTMTQAVDAVTSKYKIPKNQITFDPIKSTNQVTQKREIGYFSAVIDSSKKLTVWLDAKIPTDKTNSMMVISIDYQIPDTPDNKKNMRAAAIEKYGEPSIIWSEFMIWCEKPDPRNPMCLQISGDLQGLELNLVGTTLNLKDTLYPKILANYLEKLKTTKPAF